MATKKHYTKEFKKKVVEEYRNSSLTIEEMATKYGIPSALLQDWVNKDECNNIYISYVHTPVEKKCFRASVSGFVGVAYQKFKASGWLFAGCLPFFFAMFTFITCNHHVIEKVENDNRNCTLVAIDSLTTINNRLTKQIANMGVVLNKINGKLNFNLSPTTTIIYDYRRWNRYRRTNIKNEKHNNHNNTSISNVNDDNSTINIYQDSIMAPPSGHGKGCCCCYCCKRDTVK